VVLHGIDIGISKCSVHILRLYPAYCALNSLLFSFDHAETKGLDADTAHQLHRLIPYLQYDLRL
jgi:hypothetical protein